MERVMATKLRPGVTHLTMLIGYYTTVSLTMAAYDVPADAVGLKR
jgi:4-carboxymuconolactone decarboxylase